MRGIGDACRALDVPVTGGNVSLYNEGANGPIYPTPVIGMVGKLPDARRAAPSGFVADGHAWGLAGLEPRAVARRRPSWPSCAARRCPTGCPRTTSSTARGCSTRSATPSAPATWPAATTSPRAASWSPSPRPACTAGWARRCTDWGERPPGEALLFGEDACGFIVSGERAALDALAERIPLDVFGTVGGDTLDAGAAQLDASRAARGARRAGVAVSLAVAAARSNPT